MYLRDLSCSITFLCGRRASFSHNSIHPDNTHYEKHLPHHADADFQQCFYDLRLVWSSQTSVSQALDFSGAGQLEHRLLRISDSGPRQPPGTSSNEHRTVENPAGSGHPLGVRPLRLFLPQGTAQDELPLGGSLHPRRRLFHF